MRVPYASPLSHKGGEGTSHPFRPKEEGRENRQREEGVGVVRKSKGRRWRRENRLGTKGR
jgi:hypothetical protein